MDVFSLRESLVDQYASLAPSFTQIRAPDIHEQVTDSYESGRFWPDPLIQINPRYKAGRHGQLKLTRIAELHRPYLTFHRRHVFQRVAPPHTPDA